MVTIKKRLTTYAYDANDRLTSETGVSNIQHSATQLTRKGTAYYEYDLQGRLKTLTDGSTTVDYTYNDRGIRTSQTIGNVKTIFVIDPQSPTGYDQVLVEKVGNNVTRSYTIGHDLISQYTPSATHYFVHDGHGSTRCLTNTSGSMVERYDYDAFGNLLNHEPSAVLTEYLYCGELFDHTLGWAYLRARYYDPKVGRFNRLDPFFGNTSDPQSLHKYTYCHGDPVNHTDPSGMFLLAGVSMGASMASGIASLKNSIDLSILDASSHVMYGIQQGLSINQVYANVLMAELAGFSFGYLLGKGFFAPEAMNVLSRASSKARNLFLRRTNFAIEVASGFRLSTNARRAHYAGVNINLGEVVIRDHGFLREVAELQAEIFKAVSLSPGRGAPNAMSCLTGHFDITTVGMSTRNMEPLTHMVNGFDKYGRFSHSVVENLAVNIRHKTHGKCGEIESISWYLLEIERHLNIKINTLEDAVRFTRGTKIQTVELNELGAIAPCTHPDQGGCQMLLDALGITYVP